MQKFKKLSRKWKILTVVTLLFYIGIWGFVGVVFGRNSVATAQVGTFTNENLIPEVADFPNPINGVFYTKDEADEWNKRLPLAVIIENHVVTRPQSGLSKAEVVYEALAEGGITRFLAIFLASNTKLGPIRSNRPYFLDWVSEYKAGYAHVGGSPEAQALVKTYKIADLDQFFLGSPTYSRVSSRFAPHNVYTTTSKLRSAATSRGYKGPVELKSWSFADEELTKASRPKKFVLNLGFKGTFGYDVRWVYDRNTNKYKRFNGGKKHVDAETKKQLSAKTIVIQYVEIGPDSSGHGRIRIKTKGSGKLKVFKNGKVVVGTWKKTSRSARTRFLNKKGKDIIFNRGPIWIELVPIGSPVTY